MTNKGLLDPVLEPIKKEEFIVNGSFSSNDGIHWTEDKKLDRWNKSQPIEKKIEEDTRTIKCCMRCGHEWGKKGDGFGCSHWGKFWIRHLWGIQKVTCKTVKLETREFLPSPLVSDKLKIKNKK